MEHLSQCSGSGGRHYVRRKGNLENFQTFLYFIYLSELHHQSSSVSLWSQSSPTRRCIPRPPVFTPGSEQDIFKSPKLRDSNTHIGNILLNYFPFTETTFIDLGRINPDMYTKSTIVSLYFPQMSVSDYLNIVSIFLESYNHLTIILK